MAALVAVDIGGQIIDQGGFQIEQDAVFRLVKPVIADIGNGKSPFRQLVFLLPVPRAAGTGQNPRQVAILDDSETDLHAKIDPHPFHRVGQIIEDIAGIGTAIG